MKELQKNRSPTRLPVALTRLLPPEVVDAVAASGAPTVEELRLNADRFSTVKSRGQTYQLHLLLSRNRLRDTLQTLCAGSLYTYGESIRHGYLSPATGIRVGVCGRAATEDGKIIGVSDVTSLIIRIPHAVLVDASALAARLLSCDGGMLIYAPPGVGKTTLLRAIARECATPPSARHTVIIDTREELCYGLDGEELDLCVLSAYPRKEGIEIAVRSLGAELIVCDEIGNDGDADAILSASNCGVPMLASVHGASLQQLFSRDLLKRLHQAGVFRYYVGLERTGDELHYSVTPHAEVDKPLSGRGSML